jgi:hypothetical protein
MTGITFQTGSFILGRALAKLRILDGTTVVQ